MKSKIAAAIFALLFAVGFGAGGAFGILSLAGHLNGWWQARSWQPVAAIVLKTELQESHGDSTTYQVTVHYRYRVNERTYDGTRVGFSRGSDNIGTWQREHYQRLEAAKRAGQSIRVWVDPAQPEHSVIDREIRWGAVVFSIPFATLFPAVSLGALWVLFNVLRTPASESGASPKLANNANLIKSDARYGVRALWFFAAFWSLIAFPIAFLVVPQEFGRSWVWLLVMLFPLVGVGLIWAAATQTMRLRRNGQALLTLIPAQPHLGHSVAVRADFDRAPPGEYRVSLLCEEVDTRGEDTHYKTIWRQERAVRVNNATLTSAFLPPVHLPATEPSAGIYHRWRMLLNFPDGKDERAFDVVVSAAPEGSAARSDAAASGRTAESDVPARPIPDSMATVVDEFSRLKIDYHASTTRRTAFVIAAFGMIFASVGVFLVFGSFASGAVSILMGLVFATVGLAIIGAGIYSLTHRRNVEITRGRLRVANRWLLSAKQEEVAIAEINKLVPRISGSTSVGTQRSDRHQISALLQDGREIVLASDIRDAGVALTFMHIFQRHLGLADGAVISIADAGRSQSRLPPKTPAEEVDAKRIGKRIALGFKVVGALMVIAFLWDFLEMFR
ncbi:MAG: DUF3592 domain-containing protein [Candidatus Obscuribacterales bacterium]|nr:DUF3592 domain-containing protein [Steroidobacteraceae bacterium]